METEGPVLTRCSVLRCAAVRPSVHPPSVNPEPGLRAARGGEEQDEPGLKTPPNRSRLGAGPRLLPRHLRPTPGSTRAHRSRGSLVPVSEPPLGTRSRHRVSASWLRFESQYCAALQLLLVDPVLLGML